MIRKNIAKFCLHLSGWTPIFINKETPESSVICIAPHTSNWDFILGKLYIWLTNTKSYFLIKKEWFIFPFNIVFSAMGGIPVDRKTKNSTVDKIKELINKGKGVHIAITPEGTRKSYNKWHKGFYYIALETNIPIQIGRIDYKNKLIGIVDIFNPTGDIDTDISIIKSYYSNSQAKHPKQFSK